VLTLYLHIFEHTTAFLATPLFLFLWFDDTNDARNASPTPQKMRGENTFLVTVPAGTYPGGRSPSLKPTKVTLFTIILYNSENNI